MSKSIYGDDIIVDGCGRIGSEALMRNGEEEKCGLDG